MNINHTHTNTGHIKKEENSLCQIDILHIYIYTHIYTDIYVIVLTEEKIEMAWKKVHVQPAASRT